MYSICQLRFLKMPNYPKDQKLAIILNVYQIMFIHYLVKLNLQCDGSQSKGLIQSVKCLFSKSDKADVHVTYEISGQKLSLQEMKNIVIRRNKKPPSHYLFKMVSSNDPRVAFIDEPDNWKLLVVCIEPLPLADLQNYEIEFTRFHEKGIAEQIEEHCKNFVKLNIKKDNQNQLLIPKLFKDFVKDFGSDETDLVKHLSKLNSEELKPASLVKAIKDKTMTISYY